MSLGSDLGVWANRFLRPLNVPLISETSTDLPFYATVGYLAEMARVVRPGGTWRSTR